VHGILSVSGVLKLYVAKAPRLFSVVVQRNVHITHIPVLREEFAEVFRLRLVADITYKE